VYATARRAGDIEDLARAGAHTLALDVTDEASMAAAVEHIESKTGAVGVLVNNAGYSQSGAVESVTMDQVRRQFETNVFGAVRLAQLVLPAMRTQRWGRVVNMSSMGGKLTFPGGGFYHATKYAIEAITDALRFEVAGFGIAAILIEPGLILRFRACGRKFRNRADGPSRPLHCLQRGRGGNNDLGIRNGAARTVRRNARQRRKGRRARDLGKETASSLHGDAVCEHFDRNATSALRRRLGCVRGSAIPAAPLTRQ